MPYRWGVVHMKLDKSPPLAPCAQGGGMGLAIDRCINSN